MARWPSSFVERSARAPRRLVASIFLTAPAAATKALTVTLSTPDKPFAKVFEGVFTPG